MTTTEAVVLAPPVRLPRPVPMSTLPAARHSRSSCSCSTLCRAYRAPSANNSRAPARGARYGARVVTSDVWTEETAASYADDEAPMFAPEVLGPTVDLLARYAGTGPALEFAIGTGRVGVPLLHRGVPVTGIELSAAMVARLRERAGPGELPVVVGDMATTVVPGEFALVFLVFNSIANLRTQDEQVQCFRNAARHLAPGGRFVVELFVPPLRRLPPGQVAVPFEVSAAHTGFDTFDLVTQQCTSHHYTRVEDGSVRYGAGRFRYIWPAECDLMARLAGLELETRLGDWDGTPFTEASASHVSVWARGDAVDGAIRNPC